MEIEEKDSTIKIVFILFILSLLIVGGLFVYSKIGSKQFSLSSVFSKAGKSDQEYGYNFLLPSAAKAEEVQENTQETGNEDTGNPQSSLIDPTEVQLARDTILSPEQIKYAFDANVTTGLIGEIVIPKVNIKANILGGSDGDVLMDQGFWMYPSSATPGNGETIVLCHRRYFGQNDPRSCWNLNMLQKGDLVQVNDPSGKPIRYTVQAVSIKDPADVNIYEASKQNFLKIISCSLQSGVPGGSENRIVVIAEEI